MNKKALIIIIVVVLLCCCVSGFGAWWLWRQGTLSLSFAGIANPTTADNFTYTSSDGSLQGASGDSKPTSWPSTIPTISGGADFSYAKLGDTYYLGYEVSGSNLISLHRAQIDALESVGWTIDENSLSSETDTSALVTMFDGNDVLTLATSSDGGTISFSIIAGPSSVY